MDYIEMKGTVDKLPIVKKVSKLVLGTGDLRTNKSISEAHSLLDAYIEMGGNTIDTAHQYVGAEKAIGEWCQLRNNRDQINILSKGAHPDDPEPGSRVNANYITKDILESLDRLKTDYIDLYALHRDDPATSVESIIEVLNEHINAGRIHIIGASNWSHHRIEEANEYAYKKGLVGFSFNSPNLSLAKSRVPRWPGCVSANEATVKFHANTNMPLLSWSSQAGGFFTGRFSPDNREDAEMVNVYYSEENWERFNRAEQLAKEKNVNTNQIALAYVLNQAFPTAAIIGPRNAEELQSSIASANIVLTEEEVKWLDLQQETLKLEI